MSYTKNYLRKTVGHGKILFWPRKWQFELDLVIVQESTFLSIMPYQAWVRIKDAQPDLQSKIAWSSKSSKARFTGQNKQKNIVLPSTCTWKVVDLIGNFENVLIKEHVV
jgi:hypothetical protein